MTGILLVLGALVAVMVLSELVLGHTKLQTGLARILVAWTIVYLAVIYFVVQYGNVGILGFTIFWGGAFLSWFGVRSHIESSILLRMLHLLRQGPRDEAGIVSAYMAIGGEKVRLEELLKGGMATRQGDGFSVTPKGKTILAVVAKLR
ncbi:MAG TPA: hypothetical protein VFU02_00210 [Polyangiaceae bacterium]|nr:hypothetical protein [Polyangiaceae bacterium]